MKISGTGNNGRINVSVSTIQKALLEENKTKWYRNDFIDWFLDKFPVCSNYTITELIGIAADVDVEVVQRRYA